MTTTPPIINIICPLCKKRIQMHRPDKSGDYRIRINCPFCKNSFIIKIVDPQNKGNDVKSNNPSNNTQDDKPNVTDDSRVKDYNLDNARLVQLRKLGANKYYPLRTGENTVGRSDAQLPSDISIPSDKTMSRRSAVIQIEKAEKGFMFKFTVLKATNVVLHNNRPLQENESIYLNYGDSIVLGKTHFIFEKA